MKFFTRKMIKHEDLNHVSRLFGGTVLSWVDEEAWVYACCQMQSNQVVTKYMSEIEFVSSANLGEVVEIGIELVNIGRTSLTLVCQVRNKITQKVILQVDRIVMVAVDESGAAVPHGITRQRNIDKVAVAG